MKCDKDVYWKKDAIDVDRVEEQFRYLKLI